VYRYNAYTVPGSVIALETIQVNNINISTAIDAENTEITVTDENTGVLDKNIPVIRGNTGYITCSRTLEHRVHALCRFSAYVFYRHFPNLWKWSL
jgi:hypothetical protein